MRPRHRRYWWQRRGCRPIETKTRTVLLTATVIAAARKAGPFPTHVCAGGNRSDCTSYFNRRLKCTFVNGERSQKSYATIPSEDVRYASDKV